MLMMSVPHSFQWSDIPFDTLNTLSIKEKEAFLKKEEMNIRQNLGEAVPTVIFRQIAHKIRRVLCAPVIAEQDIKKLIEQRKLAEQKNLVDFIKKSTGKKFFGKRNVPNETDVYEIYEGTGTLDINEKVKEKIKSDGTTITADDMLSTKKVR